MQVIRLNNVGRKFQDKEGVVSGPGCGSSFFWALRNIYLNINRGEIVGIIGRNGSGKSTLLSIIAGLLPASEGEVQVNGKVSALLTLGAGFQDQFTGKENIYLNASLLGMQRQEIDRKFNNIVEFSELGDFINAPVGTYSSGMRLRLGFSIAIHQDFNILLTDEIIAVGDIYFQRKCFEKMVEFKRSGKAIVIATQDLDLVERFCGGAFLLEDGKIITNGSSSEVVEQCRLLLSKKKILSGGSRSSMISETKRWATDMEEWGNREGTQEVKIKDIVVFNKRGKKTEAIKFGEKITVKVSFVVQEPVDDFHFGVALFREDGVYCYGTNTRLDGLGIAQMEKGAGYFELEYNQLPFMPGLYYLSVAIWDKNEKYAYDYFRGNCKIEISGEALFGQLLYLPSRWANLSQLSKSAYVKYYPNLDLLVDKFGTQNNSDLAAIEQVSCLNNYGNKDNIFVFARDLKIKTDFKISETLGKSRNSLTLWVGIYRSDGIYCHGSLRKLSSYGNSEILTYPRLKLLPGGYKLSTAIWDYDNRKFLAYSHGMCQFNMISERNDHGTIYLDHSWKWKIPEARLKGKESC